MALPSLTPQTPTETEATYDQYQDHPFVKTLPPATDYLTYLTVIEYNVDKKALPLLNRLLQADERLVMNIGWDLVQILLPLLPESRPCLDTVARLGNPREVIIKVNELLEELGRGAGRPGVPSAESHVGDAHSDGESVTASAGADLDRDDDSDADGADSDLQGEIQETAPMQSTGRLTAETERTVVPDHTLVLQLQFAQLLDMVKTIHPRIKTKRPSRFLVTTAESIVSAYKTFGDRALSSNCTEVVLDLLQGLSVVTRPPLPPRANSQGSNAVDNGQAIAEDPEAEPVDISEAGLQQKVLVSFATQIYEAFVVQSRKRFVRDQATWMTRYMERNAPERLPSSGGLLRPADEELLEKLKGQEKRFLSVLRSGLGLRTNKLRELLSFDQDRGDQNVSSDGLHMSTVGSLLLLASFEFDRMESNGESLQFGPMDHRALVQEFLGRSESLDLGPTSLAILDALLILGWAWMPENQTHSFDSSIIEQNTEIPNSAQEAYNQYLQHLSLVSAHASSPILRYQSHAFVTRVIHTTKEVGLRLGYIKDTIEFCPFENLRVTAVGWLKDEILAAFSQIERARGPVEDESLFRRPETLMTIGETLFEAPLASEEEEEDGGNQRDVIVKMPYWLASLNLLYLLCTNENIRLGLKVADLVGRWDIVASFMKPLETVSFRLLEEEGRQGASMHEGERVSLASDGALLADALSRASGGLSKLAESRKS